MSSTENWKWKAMQLCRNIENSLTYRRRGGMTICKRKILELHSELWNDNIYIYFFFFTKNEYKFDCSTFFVLLQKQGKSRKVCYQVERNEKAYNEFNSLQLPYPQGWTRVVWHAREASGSHYFWRPSQATAKLILLLVKSLQYCYIYIRLVWYAPKDWNVLIHIFVLFNITQFYFIQQQRKNVIFLLFFLVENDNL